MVCKPFSVDIGFLLLILIADSGVSYADNSNETEIMYEIAAGEPTFLGEFPFMAALGWLDESGKLDFHCGGMVISSNMVLTAAHCIYLNGKIPDVVHIGGDSLTRGNTSNQEYPVLNVTIFSEYNSNQAYYDIAILELKHHTPVRPVCLWTKPNLIVKNVTAIGYGLTEYAGKQSDELLKVNLTIFAEKYCKPFFKRQRKFKCGLSHAHICAGDLNGKGDTCQGDSGGPLIVTHRYKTYAVGITSTGQACYGIPPAIYTKISSYIGWIKKVITELGSSLARQCD